MNAGLPRVAFRELMRPNLRPHLLAPDEDANLVGMRLYGLGPFHRELKPAIAIAKKSHFVIKEGDVIYNKLFAWKGTFGVVPRSLDGMFVSDKFPTYELDRARVADRYLAWFFKHPDLWEQARRMSVGSAALSKLTLNPPRFLDLDIPLPPLEEQRRIVTRIEELAAKVSEASRLREVAADEAEALRRSATERTYARLKEELGVIRLRTVCVSITDGDHQTPAFSEIGAKFIFVGNVSRGYLHFNGAKHVTKEYFERLAVSRIPRRGDILYSAVGATLGVPATVDVDEDFCFQRHVAILKPDRTKVSPRFVWHMLRSQSVFKTAWASTTGSAQPTIPLRAIRELPIPLPSLAKQIDTVTELDGIQAALDKAKSLQDQTAAELDAMLPAILDRAFKGAL